LCERMNWLEGNVGADTFGKALLSAGVSEETIMSWTKDPQVTVGGNKVSLFDSLEDINADECLTKSKTIAGVAKAPVKKGKKPGTKKGKKGKKAPAKKALAKKAKKAPAKKTKKSSLKNQAFVFIKPHAVTDKVKELVAGRFKELGFSITREGELNAATIEEKKLIDNHYYAIANKASLTKPKNLNPPANKQEDFNKLFGLSWSKALADGVVYNAVDGCAKLGISGAEMDTQWAKTKKSKQLIKFGGGFYCGKVTVGDTSIYVINGFYMAMREKYTAEGTCIYYYCVEWDSSKHSWKDFREKILGATDPTTACEGSLRRLVLEGYQALGLSSEPNVGDNGIHASASPFEALCERMNWLEGNVGADTFGKALLSAGVSEETIMSWTKDPQVTVGGNKVSLFDSLEDINADECLTKSKTIAAESSASSESDEIEKLKKKLSNNISNLNALAAKSESIEKQVETREHGAKNNQDDALKQKLKKILESNNKHLNELEGKFSSIEKKINTHKSAKKNDDKLLRSVAEKMKKNEAQLNKLMSIHNKIKAAVEQTQHSKGKEVTKDHMSLKDKQIKILKSLDKLEARVKQYLKGKKLSSASDQRRLEELMAKLK